MRVCKGFLFWKYQNKTQKEPISLDRFYLLKGTPIAFSLLTVAFSYGLIGQSATSGILAQQLIITDGGFKSFIGTTANRWITAFNVDSHVWKWFNIYADAGIYKNVGRDSQFIWDSGVKVKVIPDFLEVYFPIQSSLGFEPSFKDYGKRIRFTLVLNFSAVTNYFRRGWF